MTSVVQSKFAEALTSTSVSVTLDATPTAGSLLVAILHVSSGTGIGSSPVHPWGLSGPDVSAGTSPVVNVYSKVAGPGESATITFSSGQARNYTLSVIEIAPTSGKVWNGKDVSATNTGTAVSSLALGPTGTQVDTDDIAVAGIAIKGAAGTAPSWSSSFTTVGSPASGGQAVAGYKVLTTNAATSTTGSWSTARDTAGVIATYKQTVPLPPTGFIALL